MDQTPLFFESLSDALRDLVRALGGHKVVGSRMRPEMPADHAGRWLSDCLNDGRREHLTPEQTLWLLREARAIGHHAAMAYIAGEAGYAKPLPVEPEDERDALLREYIATAKSMAAIATAKSMAAIAARIERNSGAVGVRAVA